MNLKGRIKELSEIIKRNPEIKELYMERAKLYDMNKEYKKAVEDFKKAYPGYYACENIISVCEKLGLYQEAEKLYTKAINEDKKNVRKYINRLNFYIRTKQIEKAVLDCKNILRLSPEDKTILALKKILTK